MFNSGTFEIAPELSLSPFINDHLIRSKSPVNSPDRRRPGRVDVNKTLVPLLRGSTNAEDNSSSAPVVAIAERPISDLDPITGVLIAGAVSLALWILAGLAVWVWVW
jgi:hypothetical protein